MSNEHSQHAHVVASFTELWSPEWIVICALLLVGYFLITTKYRYVFKDAEPVSFRHKAWFIFAVILIYIAKGSPINFYGHHYLFSAHMIQMSILYLTVPPLLLYGIPAWLIRPVVLHPAVRQVFQFFTMPLIALILFNGLFSIYHLPVVFNAVMTSHWLHGIVHLVLLFAAFIMWWPIICPVPELESLTPLKKIGYIFADGVLLTPACALIIFSGTVLYDPYLSAPQVLSYLPILEDQQLGGVIMKVIQEIVYGSILGYIFVNWFKKTREKEDLEYERISNSSEVNPV